MTFLDCSVVFSTAVIGEDKNRIFVPMKQTIVLNVLSMKSVDSQPRLSFDLSPNLSSKVIGYFNCLEQPLLNKRKIMFPTVMNPIM